MRADAVHALTEAADAAAAQLFVHDCFMPEVASGSAILVGYVEAQQPCLTQQPPRFAIDVVLRAPAGLMGNHLGFHEPSDRIAERSQVIVHPVGGVGGHWVGLIVSVVKSLPSGCRSRGGLLAW